MRSFADCDSQYQSHHGHKGQQMNGNVFMVVMIVGIVMCASVMKTYLKQRDTRQEPDEELEQTLAKIDVLEERIKVLERIVTENRFDLKKEIDSL